MKWYFDQKHKPCLLFLLIILSYFRPSRFNFKWVPQCGIYLDLSVYFSPCLNSGFLGVEGYKLRLRTVCVKEILRMYALYSMP